MKLYDFELFANQKIVHGISTKEHGDMQNPLNREKFAGQLSINSNFLKGMNQVHGTDVVVIDKSNFYETIKADAMITKQKNVFLSVVTADCIPVLFVDPTTQMVAVAHAGWKGLLNGVISETITQMQKMESDPSRILVGLGPSIRSCCYIIDNTRAHQFLTVFPDWGDKIVLSKNGQQYLDMQTLAFLQLVSCGIEALHIMDLHVCTRDNESFYSYRREGNSPEFGEFVSIIGLV
jgi:YfiH family protein